MYVKGGMWVIETADRRKYRIQLPAPEPAGVPQWDVMRLALPAYVASGEKRAKVENLPKIETAGSIDRFALTLLPGSSLVDQVQLYAARKSEHKTLVVVPDQKTLDKFERLM